MNNTFNEQKAWIGIRRLFSSSNKWVIHPRFSTALWRDRFEDHLKWLINRPEIHVIHIARRQGLDWLKSLYVGKKTNLYSGKAYPNGIKVRIHVGEAVARLHSKDWIDCRLSSLASANPYVKIEYEDFLENQNTVTARTLRFLECD